MPWLKSARAATRLAASVAAFLLVAAGLARADVPAPFATLSGACPAGQQSVFSASPVTATHSNVVVRYAATSGSPALDGTTIPAGRVQWYPRSSAITTNSTPSVSVYNCSSQASAFQVAFYDRPSAPVTYSGVGNSDLPFTYVGDAQYVADLQLSTGAVALSTSYCCGGTQQFASSGQYSLGTVGSQDAAELDIRALDGPAPVWTVTIRPLPVAITDAAFATPISRPGTVIQANYKTTGDTAITATVLNAAGQPVRNLASGLGVTTGSHSLSWDGRGGGGAPLPDGTYTLALTSHDANGLTSSQSASVVVDGSPPAVVMTSPATLSPGEPVSAQATDALSGVSELTLGDSDDYRYAGADNGAPVSYVPYSGWTLGAHALTATATDKAGNSQALTLRFTVAQNAVAQRQATTPSKPTCSKSSAKTQADGNAAFLSYMRTHKLAQSGRSVFADGSWSIWKVFCHDLTGDHRTDMAFVLIPPTTAKVVLAVFRNTGTGWQLGYKTLTWMSSMKVSGGSVRFTVPHYRRTDALCCPTGRSTRYQLRFRKDHFARVRLR
jgi:hypothetical protein